MENTLEQFGGSGEAGKKDKLRYIWSYVGFFLRAVFYGLTFWFSDLRGKEPIVVFQMGKVGSKTIVDSLERLELGTPIYHIHRLSPDGLEFIKQMSLARHRSLPIGKHYFIAHFLRRQLTRRDNDKYWNVVALVREPVARNISAFFHTIDAWYPDFYYQYESNKESISFAELTEVFLERFPHDIPLTWFDSEMQYAFGIDVFSSEFPRQEGYEIYQGENVKLLVMRLEDIARCARKSFSQFLGIEGFTLVNANVGSEKAYGAIYREFLEGVDLPDSYIARMYESKYAQHFYSEKEIQSFAAMWSKKAPGHPC